MFTVEYYLELEDSELELQKTEKFNNIFDACEAGNNFVKFNKNLCAYVYSGIEESRVLHCGIHSNCVIWHSQKGF